jgi:hypothetical protein
MEQAMTRKEVEEELNRDPFVPFRLHLVSGKSLDVNASGEGWMLEESILITRRRKNREPSYNVVALVAIERLERLNQD